MTEYKFIKNILKSIGENNKATYAVVAIATVKGIFRPLFTMMDKKENPETKKYTALREGLTEIIAIPVYLGCGELAAKLGEHIVSKGMDNKFQKDALKGKIYSEQQKLAMKTEAIKKGQKGLMFIGVCAAALFVIPGTCSLVIKPLMNKLGMNAPKKNLDITEGKKTILPNQQPVGTITRPAFQSITPKVYSSMKVGGV